MLRFDADYKEFQACNRSNVLIRLNLFTEAKSNKDHNMLVRNRLSTFCHLVCCETGLHCHPPCVAVPLGRGMLSVAQHKGELDLQYVKTQQLYNSHLYHCN